MHTTGETVASLNGTLAFPIPMMRRDLPKLLFGLSSRVQSLMAIAWCAPPRSRDAEIEEIASRLQFAGRSANGALEPYSRATSNDRFRRQPSFATQADAQELLLAQTRGRTRCSSDATETAGLVQAAAFFISSGFRVQATQSCSMAEYLRRDAPLTVVYGMKPSLSVCMKLTIASSSASVRPRFPTWFLFMLSVDSGAGQHVVPSPASWGWQRGRTSRVL